MDVHERLAEDSREQLNRMRDESDKYMDKMQKDADDLDEKSVQNFAAWRDYLHKYYTIVLAFIAGSGILASTNTISDYRLTYGIFFALIGILIGFVGINIYFWIERKWFQAQSTMKTGGYYDFHKHPKADDGNVLKAIRFHLSDKLQPFLVELKEARKTNDRKKIRQLKIAIRGRREEMFLLYFVGEQFGVIQKIWVGFVAASLTLTFAGLIVIFIAIAGNGL